MSGWLPARWVEEEQSQNPDFWLSIILIISTSQSDLKANKPIAKWESCKVFMGNMDIWCSQNKTAQTLAAAGWCWEAARLFHCRPLLNRSSESVGLGRLPLWQWLINSCHISYVSMTASGLTNVTKLCFISKSPAGPSQESIWIRRENRSSCSLLLTDSALCMWTSQLGLVAFLCNLPYLLYGAEPVIN